MATTQEKLSSTSELAPGDLPDPLELPTKTPPSVDADEIISQLASTQIEKMLADANVDSEEAVVEDVAPIESVAQVAPEAEPVEPVMTQATVVEATAEEFSRIISDEPSSFDGPSQPSPEQAAEQAMADMQSAAAELARELESDEAQKPRALKTERIESMERAPQPRVGVRVGFGILSAINSPFRNLSDNTRELIGSIAIITLVNALSILLYVMIYR